MTVHPSVDEAKHFLGRYGFFVRDEGLLASAVSRPATTVMGQDVFEPLELKAAVLLESAARNHPLVADLLDPDGAVPVAERLPARLHYG